MPTPTITIALITKRMKALLSMVLNMKYLNQCLKILLFPCNSRNCPLNYTLKRGSVKYYNNSSIILSTVRPSASALKLRTILCLSVGFAISRISSMSGEYFPLIRELHFAASTRYCDALGPAPHSRKSVAMAGDLSIPGRDLCTRLTAYSITLSAIGTCRTRC